MASRGGKLQISSMAKRGRKPGPRGPYKTKANKRGKGSEVLDPDQLGGGGIRLRQHRLAKAWTVEVMAERAGVSPGTVSQIENGGGYSFETLHKLATALGTSIGALFDVDPRQGGGAAFWPVWEALGPTERQRVMDYAQGVKGGRK